MIRDNVQLSNRPWLMGALLAVVLLIGLEQPSALGSVLYASVNDGDASEIVYTINQASGTATALGPSGFSAPLDLTSDWRPGSFRIWGADTDSNRLITINPNTGAGTVVGGFGTASPMRSLAFSTNTGTLYGSTDSDVLYEINPVNANSTLIGPIGFGSVFGLAFDLTGTLYGVAGTSLLRISTSTGAGTVVAATIGSITDIAARPEDGVMFAVETLGDRIYRLNLTNGQTTLVGPHGVGVNFMVGLAFSPAIPEPAAAGLLGIGVFLVGMCRWRRRRL